MMKKYFYLLMMCAAAVLTSCYDDDSTLGTEEVGEIAIVGGIEESYTGLLDNGETLTINPQIKSDYPESDLEYHWYIYQPSKVTESADLQGNYYDRTEIGTSKQLSLPIDLEVGDYVLILNVMSKTNHYSVQATTKLNVSTRYAQGFYVLKEVDGASDVDFFNMSDEKIENVIKRINGSSVAGEPANLTVSYNRAYLDRETNGRDYSTMLVLVTKDGKINYFRTSDLKKVLDNSTLFYGNQIAGEVPYCELTNYFTSLYVASTGVFYTQQGGQTGVNSAGILGNPMEPRGASRFIVKQNRAYGLTYWNEQEHGIYCFNSGNGVVQANGTEAMPVSGLTNYECIASGCFFDQAYAYFLFRDVTNDHHVLYVLQGTWTGSTAVQKVIDLGTDILRSDCGIYAFNEKNAQYAYYISGNQLHAFNLGYNVDTDYAKAVIDMPLEGIGAGEQIVYLNHCYRMADYSNYVFNYLVVGTQTGNTYKVYMYNMVGGQPDGAPVKTLTGTGKLRNMSYVHPQHQTFWWSFFNIQ